MKPENRLFIFHETAKENGSVAAFIELYDSLSPMRFIQFGLKEKNDSKDELFRISAFWNQFILNRDVLGSFLKEKSWDQLIFWYFSNEDLHSYEFLMAYAEIDPDRLIRDIRLNQAFLNEKIRESLSLIRLPREYQNHQKCWEELYTEDQNKWSKILWKKECWSDVGVEEFLTNLVHWLESKRFEDDEDGNTFHLSICYNFIIELYASEFSENLKNFSKERFQIMFNGKLIYRDKKLSESFQAVYDWTDMNERKIIQYAWDLNIKPVFMGQSMGYECYDREKMDNWLKNDVRYKLNERRYFRSGMFRASYKIHENGLEIPGKNEQARELNVELLIKELSSHIFISDLCLDKIAINGACYNLHDFVGPILGYSFNRSNRYETKLAEFSESSRSWEESFLKLNQYSAKIDVDCDPYFLLTEEMYIGHIKQASPPEQAKVFPEIAHQLTKRFSREGVFDRHNVAYDVWFEPFISFGNYLFCPMLFFARNSWFYSFVQIAMRNHRANRRLEEQYSKQIEKDLMSMFESANPKWQCDMPPENKKGDVDLLVSDSKYHLFIQLKRTYLRTNLRDAYFEEIMVDQKAISQLNEREELVKNDFTGRIIKWYVSTSFENCNQEMEGCIKINYFELIWALREKKFETILDLEKYMRNDEILNEKLFDDSILNE